ncbi:MAG: hypothetical protein D6797_02595 [Bdellovibrio sp.]|nr:MAG: hypothetical protein D6797_02595 [Bdellovibrio sp.]
MRFLVDEMLFDVAKYLRFMGYGVEVMRSGTPDKEILARTEEDGLVLITADKELYKIAKKNGDGTIFLDIRKSLEEKLAIVIKKANLYLDFERSRCPKCGGELHYIDSKDVNVPEFIKKTHKKVQECLSCKHVYWKGSHWEAMVKRVERAFKLASKI